VNDVISGECVPVPDPDLEPTQFYKVSKLKLITRSTTIINNSEPWEPVPPELEVYRLYEVLVINVGQSQQFLIRQDSTPTLCLKESQRKLESKGIYYGKSNGKCYRSN
jgi:hypothetical protein